MGTAHHRKMEDGGRSPPYEDASLGADSHDSPALSQDEPPTMNCRDTERLWNDLLDARDVPRPDLEAALLAHAAACPACAASSARYRALRRALETCDPPTAPSEFVARILQVYEDDPSTEHVLPFGRPISVPRGAWLSAAAAALVAGAVGLWAVPLGKKDKLADAPTPPPAASLADALADATSATLELARDASAPAGRVGRAVLASASLPSPAPPAPEVGVGASSRVIQSVGGRVGAGVRPLSGSAQHAFGFLLPSAAAVDLDGPPAAPRNGA